MDEVFKSTSKDNLLVYDVKQGWDPLCQFLNLPSPAIPFPKINESAEIQSAIWKMKIFSWTVTLGVPGLALLTLGCFLWKKFK